VVVVAETFSALREYRRRVAAMLEDPDCTDDLFALGVSLLDFAVLRLDREERTWRYYGERAWGKAHGWKIREVLRKDIRRYDAVKDAEQRDPARRCGAPMMRRQGPCGQSASQRAMLTDADTGRKQWLGACSRHREWFEGRVRSNRAEVEVANPVRPAANAGGVLARHIPEIDWEATWIKLDPKWTPPPEVEPEEVPIKPRLTLVLGGA
jgi:hypothetical protein